jgi:GTP-binding protein
MGKKVRVALVGRPNVGKSALFNSICKKRIAIVDEAEGITRDRLYAQAELFGKPFEVIDTGGINPQSEVAFQEEIRRQTEIAIEEADAIIMVVDRTCGVTGLDEYVSRLLLRTGKPVVLAVNKIDDFSQRDDMYPFYALGISNVVPVSAVHHFNVAELLEAALARISWDAAEEEQQHSIRVAIVGRPNVGKSTIVNFLLDEERCVVSPIAGTTRDSIDIAVESEGEQFTLIDTAGIRRKKAEREAVDKFAAVRTERAIDRADVCVLVLDAVQGMSVQEKRIAHEIEEKGKGCVVLFNKWDLVKGFRMEHCKKSFETDIPFLTHCPALFASGKTGRNLDSLFSVIKDVHTQQNRRITTGQLNKFLEKVVQKYHPPMIDGKRLRIYYMAQIDVQPPRFVLFVNKPELMVDSYKKYLLNQFREAYQFTGAPIEFILKPRSRREDGDSSPKRKEAAPECEDLCAEEELDASYFN